MCIYHIQYMVSANSINTNTADWLKPNIIMLNMHDFKERIEQPCVQITKYILKQSTYCIKHQKNKMWLLLIWRNTSWIHMSEASAVSSPRCFISLSSTWPSNSSCSSAVRVGRGPKPLDGQLGSNSQSQVHRKLQNLNEKMTLGFVFSFWAFGGN